MAEKSSEGIAPFQQADLPEKTGTFWQLAGPGAILVGLSIGSGELIMWPRIAAKYGPNMLWAAGIGTSPSSGSTLSWGAIRWQRERVCIPALPGCPASSSISLF